MSAPFHNTTNLTGDALTKAVSAAKVQNEVILDYFLKMRTPFTPWEMFRYCQKKGHRYLIGSIRRSFSNLTDKYKDLVKLPTKKMGPQGALEHAWELNTVKHPLPVEQGKLF